MGCNLSKPVHHKHRTKTYSDTGHTVSCLTRAVQVGDGDVNREIPGGVLADDTVTVITAETPLPKETLPPLRKHAEKHYDGDDFVKRSPRRQKNSKHKTVHGVTNKDDISANIREEKNISKLKKVSRFYSKRNDIHIVGDIDGEYCIHVDLSSRAGSPDHATQNDIESACTDISALTKNSSLSNNANIDQIIPGIGAHEDRSNSIRGFQAVCSDEDSSFRDRSHRGADSALTNYRYTSPYFKHQHIHKTSICSPSSPDEATDLRYKAHCSEANKNIIFGDGVCKKATYTDEFTGTRRTTVSDCNLIRHTRGMSKIQPRMSNDSTTSMTGSEISLPIFLDCRVNYLSKHKNMPERIEDSYAPTSITKKINLTQSNHEARLHCTREHDNHRKMRRSTGENDRIHSDDIQHGSVRQHFDEGMPIENEHECPIPYWNKGVPCTFNSQVFVPHSSPTRTEQEKESKLLSHMKLEKEARYTDDNCDTVSIRECKYIRNVPFFGTNAAQCASLHASGKQPEGSEETETDECDLHSTSHVMPDFAPFKHSKSTISHHFGPRSADTVQIQNPHATSLESRHDDGRPAMSLSAKTVCSQSPTEQSRRGLSLNMPYRSNDKICRILKVGTKGSNINGSAVRAEVADYDTRNTNHRHVRAKITNENFNKSEIPRNSDTSETDDTADSSSETTVSETVSNSQEVNGFIDRNASSSYAEYISAQDVWDKQVADYSDCNDSIKGIDDYWGVWLKKETK